MTEILKTLQLILFGIPVVALVAMGVVILAKPVSVLNRRWYLAIFLPLLLANGLSILENLTVVEAASGGNWRMWLVLVADLALVVGCLVYFRGYLVYGLSGEQTEVSLAEGFRSQGYDVSLGEDKKRGLLGGLRLERVLTLVKNGHQVAVWVKLRFHEVTLQAGSQDGVRLLRKAIPGLRSADVPYDIKAHASGVLFIVLGVVFAVLSWIFFFEPRLVLMP